MSRKSPWLVSPIWGNPKKEGENLQTKLMGLRRPPIVPKEFGTPNFRPPQKRDWGNLTFQRIWGKNFCPKV